jgi:monoamine oxidase
MREGKPVTDFECVVVGGGIAGLAAAYYLRDKQTLVLEGSERFGGRVMSVSRGDYWANLGAQFVAPQGPLGELATLPGVQLNRVVGDPQLNFDGRVVKATPLDMMLRSRLPLRTRAGLATFGAQLEIDYRRMDGKSDRARAHRVALDDRRASDLFRAKGSTKPILEALSRSWLSAELDEVSGAHATAFFHHGMASGRGMSDLTFPTGGSESVVHAVVAEIEPTVRLQTRAMVRRVSQTSSGVEVEYETDGAPTVVTARTCVMAAPAYAAREIVTGLPAEYLDALRVVNVGSFISAGVFTNEADPQPWDDYPMITAPGRDFQTVFNPVSVTRVGPRKPGGALSMYAGGDRSRALVDADDATIRERVIGDLTAILPLRTDQIDEVIIQRWPLAMPYWAPGGYARMKGLRKPVGRISFAGDYLGQPGMPSAAAAAKVAADSALAALSA